jgi:hypothetical protein
MSEFSVYTVFVMCMLVSGNKLLCFLASQLMAMIVDIIAHLVCVFVMTFMLSSCR